MPWVNQLKLRASYGVTGNSNTGNYPYQAGFDIGWDDDKRPGVIVSSLGSPQLTWETQKPLDLGLDFALFKNSDDTNIQLLVKLIETVNQTFESIKNINSITLDE